MLRPFRRLLIPLAAACATGLPATHAQVIENELVLITPVAKTLTDPALAEFVKYAKERWNVTVRTNALAAGTPVAYGRIVEWKGRPEADIFWGGESAGAAWPGGDVAILGLIAIYGVVAWALVIVVRRHRAVLPATGHVTA